ECLMNLFVGLMNEHTKDAGLNLTNSRWITVHGGDGCDFTIGCDPDCKLGSCNLATCQKGQTCPGAGTTVRDVTRLWHRLTVMDPNFLPLIGARAFSLKTSSKAFYNSYNHAFGFYYPGVAGDKNGGSAACPVTTGSASCWTAEAVRAGHPLNAAVLQSFTNPQPNVFVASGAADVAALFTYGYSFVLAPVRRIDSGNQAADIVKDHALACDEGTCYSAFRTQNDTLHITAWNVSTDVPLLDRLATYDASSYGPVTSLDVATHFYRV